MDLNFEQFGLFLDIRGYNGPYMGMIKIILFLHFNYVVWPVLLSVNSHQPLTRRRTGFPDDEEIVSSPVTTSFTGMVITFTIRKQGCETLQTHPNTGALE